MIYIWRDNKAMKLTLFLTELITLVYLFFIKNDIFFNGRTQLQTPDQGQAPSHASKTWICFQKCDKSFVTKDAMFTASLHARQNGNSDVVT